MRYLFLLLLFTTGCETVRINRTPPHTDLLKSIAAEPYIEHLYDCSNKSSKYCRILRDKGYKANLMITRIKGQHHAIVVVEFKNGEIIYCDPTSGRWSYEIDDYGIPDQMVPWEERLDKKWRNEFIEIF